MKVIVRDCEMALDPSATAPPDTLLDIEDREIGGLGILLIRGIATEVRYERIGSYNLLSFVNSQSEA